MDDIAGFEAFGGEEATAGAFDVGFLDLHIHLFFTCAWADFGLMKLKSIDVLGVTACRVWLFRFWRSSKLWRVGSF